MNRRSEIIILLLILSVSLFTRVYKLNSKGYVTDEPLIITTGIKHFINNPYPPSLYDMNPPVAQWIIGLSTTLLTDKNYTKIREYSMMDYASIDQNRELLTGLEFPSRLPSALIGVLSGLIVYFLVKEMYNKKTGMVCFGLYSFNPLLIDYSRVALLEIYQVTFTLASLTLLYYSLKKQNLSLMFLTGVGVGLTTGVKLTGLLLIPCSVLFIILNYAIKKKNKLMFELDKVIKYALLLLSGSVITLLIVFNFNTRVPLIIYEYYSQAGGAGVKFVLPSLLKQCLFFFHPVLLMLVIGSVYYLLKEGFNGFDNKFLTFLVFLVLVSGFFEANAGIKRGIQYACVFYILISKVLSKCNDRALLALFLIITSCDLLLVYHFFPNTGLSKNVLCVNHDCQERYGLRNYDSRLVANYFKNKTRYKVFDSTLRTGLTGFYLPNDSYYAAGIIRLYLSNCPSVNWLKSNGFTHIIKNNGCLNHVNYGLNNQDCVSINYNGVNITNVCTI